MPDNAKAETWRIEKLLPTMVEVQKINPRFMTASWLLGFASAQNGGVLRDVILEIAPNQHGGLPSARSLGVFLKKCVNVPCGGFVLRRYFSAQTRWRVLPDDAWWKPGSTWE
jgi:hypothetical protein